MVILVQALLSVVLWALLLAVDAWFIHQTVGHPISNMHWPQLAGHWAAVALAASFFARVFIHKRRRASGAWFAFALAIAAGAQWGSTIGHVAAFMPVAIAGAAGLIRLARPLVASLALLMAWVSCAPFSIHSSHTTPDPKLPDIVLITIDTVREDALSSSPQALIEGLTPRLDAMATAGCRIDQATATSPLTGPSHAGMLSGVHPIDLGLFQNGRVLPKTIPWLPESLQDMGYATGGFVSSAMLHGSLGYNRGFDVYDDDQSGHAALLNSTLAPIAPRPSISKQAAFWRRGTETIDRMNRWLQGTDPDRPVFVWLHLYDAHRPYTATLSSKRFVASAILDLPEPASFPQWAGSRAEKRAEDAADTDKQSFTRSLFDKLSESVDLRPLEDKPNRLALQYLAGVRDLDTIVGHAWDGLLERRPNRERVWAIVADHGESLTEHAELGSHQHNVYEANIRIPFLLSSDDCPAGPVSNATVGTELAKLADIGLKWDASDAIESVVRAGKKSDHYPKTLKVSKRMGDDKAVLGYHGNVLRFAEHYNVARDPHEQRPEPNGGGRFSAFKSTIGNRLRTTSSAETTDASVNDALRALGYIE